MNPQDLSQEPNLTPAPPEPAPIPQINNPLSVMQPGEQVICEIKRHPIGLFGVYSISGTLLLVLAILAFVVGPAAFSDNRHQATFIGGIVFLVLGGLLLSVAFIANKVYWGNSWVVTSDSITQITQTGLFHKQSSQLSLGNLEDVTAEQNGMLPQLFKYGALRAETAGESSKFVFPYCPNPNYYAQKILAAREVFEQKRHVVQPQPQLEPLQQPQPQPEFQPQPPVAPVPPVAPPVYPDTPQYNDQNPDIYPQ